MVPKYEVADILNKYWSQIRQKSHLNPWQLRTLNAIKRCRTASLGGHIDGCTNCKNANTNAIWIKNNAIFLP
ncbi:transposase zinc-binding domain-containing protein [Arachidicoccus ginsenosidivorans]